MISGSYIIDAIVVIAWTLCFLAVFAGIHNSAAIYDWIRRKIKR